VVQTGIVNLEAGRRLVAAEVPAGVLLGNSVNAWVPRPREGFTPPQLRGYLLGLLNSAPLEWRFRSTSSNNNINLYEIQALPLPPLAARFPTARLGGYLEQVRRLVAASSSSVLGVVREITSGWGAPSREDRAAALLIAEVARLREAEAAPGRRAWLEHVTDHLVTWHLGLDESDLFRMLKDLPAREYKEKA
jgi:hypothetical protein